LFFSVPRLARAMRGMTVETVSADASAIDGLDRFETDLLVRHAGYGCLSLVCRTGAGVFPFIFMPLRIRRGWIAPPAMQLVYSRDVAQFIACAGAIGRRLLRHGKLAVLLNANGPIPGLAGVYTEARGRKYFRGPHRPSLSDLTDTEFVLYGP
jgi:hypothetical protein